MKKSIFTKMGAAAMVLTLVTASLVGGTFAKYTSEKTGVAEATVAKWSIKLTDTANELSEANKIVLKNENTKIDLNDGVIAPGAYGTMKVAVDGSGTQVGFDYKVTIDTTGLPSTMKFYKGSSSADATAEKLISGDGINGSIAYNASEKNVEIPVYWVWEDANTSDGNSADTSVGEAATGTATTINLTLTATQITDNTSTQ